MNQKFTKILVALMIFSFLLSGISFIFAEENEDQLREEIGALYEEANRLKEKIEGADDEEKEELLEEFNNLFGNFQQTRGRVNSFLGGSGGNQNQNQNQEQNQDGEGGENGTAGTDNSTERKISVGRGGGSSRRTTYSKPADFEIEAEGGADAVPTAKTMSASTEVTETGIAITFNIEDEDGKTMSVDYAVENYIDLDNSYLYFTEEDAEVNARPLIQRNYLAIYLNQLEDYRDEDTWTFDFAEMTEGSDLYELFVEEVEVQQVEESYREGSIDITNQDIVYAFIASKDGSWGTLGGEPEEEPEEKGAETKESEEEAVYGIIAEVSISDIFGALEYLFLTNFNDAVADLVEEVEMSISDPEMTPAQEDFVEALMTIATVSGDLSISSIEEENMEEYMEAFVAYRMGLLDLIPEAEMLGVTEERDIETVEQMQDIVNYVNTPREE